LRKGGTPVGRENLSVRVGARLRALRLAAGLSQEKWGKLAAEAAERLGFEVIGGPQWGKLERGEQTVNCIHLEVAALALKISVIDLIDDAQPVKPAGLSDDALTVARIVDTEGRKAAIMYLVGGLR